MRTVIWGGYTGDRWVGSRSDLLMAKMARDLATLRRKIAAALAGEGR